MTVPARVIASGWGWRYAGRRLPAVSAATLTIEPGKRVLLLGASGSGKSTLLAGMAGLLGGEEDGERAGSLTVNGAPAERARGVVGLVQQDPDAGIVLSTVESDVAFGLENAGVPREEMPGRIGAALAAVGWTSRSIDRRRRFLVARSSAS